MPAHPQLSIADDRSLTATEERLIRFVLGSADVRAQSFLAQLEASRVVSRCDCGCARIDLFIGGIPARPDAPLQQLGDDYFWLGPRGGICSVFVFAKSDRLAGLETYSVDGVETPAALPSVKSLQKEPWGLSGE